MLPNAGAQAELEAAWWDVGPTEDGESHVRPDIFTTLTTGERIVVDVAGCWRHLTSDRPRYRKGGHGAHRAEKDKQARYLAAMHRRHQQEAPNMSFEQWREMYGERFFAAGFECTGALGPEFTKFLAIIIASAECDKVGADLYHWSAMTFERHWRTMIGAAIMRGVARAVARGARVGRQNANFGGTGGRHVEEDPAGE